MQDVSVFTNFIFSFLLSHLLREVIIKQFG